MDAGLFVCGSQPESADVAIIKTPWLIQNANFGFDVDAAATREVIERSNAA